MQAKRQAGISWLCQYSKDKPWAACSPPQETWEERRLQTQSHAPCIVALYQSLLQQSEPRTNSSIDVTEEQVQINSFPLPSASFSNHKDSWCPSSPRSRSYEATGSLNFQDDGRGSENDSIVQKWKGISSTKPALTLSRWLALHGYRESPDPGTEPGSTRKLVRSPLDLEAPDNVGLPQGQVYLLPSQGEGLQITVVVQKSGFLVLRPNGSSQGARCPLSFCVYLLCLMCFSNLCQGTRLLAVNQNALDFL